MFDDVCGISLALLKAAAAQAAKRAERETLTTESRMRGRPRVDEERVKPRTMGPPRELSEEEKARRQKRQVLRRQWTKGRPHENKPFAV